MIGFIENKYTVIKQLKLMDNEDKIYLEIRKEEGPKIDPAILELIKSKGHTINWYEEKPLNYIAIYSKNNGVDRLYYYKDDEESMNIHLNADWDVLTTNYKLTMKHLKCSSMVINHGYEHTRDGRMIMW